jgi:hypothetical protein
MLEVLRARDITLETLANNANEATFNFLHVNAHGKLPTTSGGGKVTIVALAAAAIVITGGFMIMVSSSRRREST